MKNNLILNKYLCSHFLYFFFLLFGLIIGSFLNCLVWRLYKEETLGGRSYCPQCHHQIDWYDNLPVLSFIILRGKCRHCHKKISWQYPLVELIVSLLFGLSFFHFFGFNVPSENCFTACLREIIHLDFLVERYFSNFYNDDSLHF